MGNAEKAETHRICNENSEDALSWNVFSRFARGEELSAVLSTLTGRSSSRQPELYLWGLKIDLDGSTAPGLFPELTYSRGMFEQEIRKFKTEPDIMLYAPGESLLLIEAKFTSGNTIASGMKEGDISGEKPKSREGILARYSLDKLPDGAMLEPSRLLPFYSQLYRNLFFAQYMAARLGVQWGLVNLVSSGQFQRRKGPAFADPTPSIHSMLPNKSKSQFRFYSWEKLFADCVSGHKELQDLDEYLRHKSSNGANALDI